MDGTSNCHPQHDAGICLGCRAPPESQPKCREKGCTGIWKWRERGDVKLMSRSTGKQEGRKVECTAVEGVVATLHEGSQRFLASAGLRNLPRVTKPVLGPWAHLALPLGPQARRREGHG